MEWNETKEGREGANGKRSEKEDGDVRRSIVARRGYSRPDGEKQMNNSTERE
jgi:hypothetical protein